ncbi:MAG: hypothetical protein Q7S00_04620, partial [bacterium]|nr:hypothetical protein [bacterium]
MKKLLLASAFFLVACSSSSQKSDSNFVSTPPQKLTALGVPLAAYVVVSTDPTTRHPLTLDEGTNSFKGDVKVPTGSTFDLTVVYTADDS